MPFGQNSERLSDLKQIMEIFIDMRGGRPKLSSRGRKELNRSIADWVTGSKPSVEESGQKVSDLGSKWIPD